MAMAVDNNGNSYYAVKGHYLDFAPGGDDFKGVKILKYNSSGVKTGSFFFRYTNGQNDFVSKLLISGTNLYVLVNGEYDSPPFDYDVIVLKLNTNTMSQVWMRAYNHDTNYFNDQGMDMILLNNHIYVTCEYNGKSVFLKYTTGGALLISQVYDHSNSSQHYPSMMFSSGPDIYVLGRFVNSNGTQVELLKYDLNLNNVWIHRRGVSALPYADFPSHANCDPSGNIYICGSFMSASGLKPFLQKLNPLDGSRVWIKKPSFTGSHFTQVFTDANDNPFGIISPMPYRYYKVDKNTAVVMRNQTLFNSSSMNFNLTSQVKGGNNLYIGGEYDSTFTWINPDDSSEIEIMQSGIKVFKLNVNGSRSGVLSAGDEDGHNWETNPRLAFKSNKLYCIYNYSSVAVSPGDNESWCKINCVNFSVPIREGDIEKHANLNIWPNPSAGVVTFRIPEGMDVNTNWELFSVEGKLLNSGQAEAVPLREEYTIETGKYPTGTYIFRISNENIQYNSLIQME